MRIKALDDAIAEWRELEHEAERLKGKARLAEGHVQWLLLHNQRSQYVFFDGGMEKKVFMRTGKSKLMYDEVPEDTLKRKANGKGVQRDPVTGKVMRDPVPNDADKKRVAKDNKSGAASKKSATKKSAPKNNGKPWTLGDSAKRRALKKNESKRQARPPAPVTEEKPQSNGAAPVEPTSE